ncbi:hypothetical protein ACFX2C_017111 [Malus domestica]
MAGTTRGNSPLIYRSALRRSNSIYIRSPRLLPFRFLSSFYIIRVFYFPLCRIFQTHPKPNPDHSSRLSSSAQLAQSFTAQSPISLSDRRSILFIDYLKLVDLLVGQFLYAMLGAALPIFEKLWDLNGGLALAKMKNFLEGYCTLS